MQVGTIMGILTFRAYKTDILKSLTKPQQQLVEHRIQYTLDLLGQETLSREGIAIIASLALTDPTTCTTDYTKLLD